MKRILKNCLIAACWLLLWQLGAMAVGSPVLLPSPWETAKAFVALAGTGFFWKTAGATLLRVAAGFLLGMAAGAALGILTAFSRLADDFLAPIRGIIKATPVTSFIILVWLWLTTTLTPVFIAFLMVTPIAWANVREGILAVDAQLLEMAEVFRLPRAKKLRHVYLPSVLPQWLAACTTGFGFAWKSGVAAEVIARPALSIGRNLYESKLYLNTEELFAWTAMVVLLSMLLERLLVRAMRRIRR